jgi:hypothetical protein
MESAELKSLLDRQAIVEVFNRYATGIDSRDHDLYGQCFTEELEVEIAGMPEGVRPAKDWVDRAIEVVGAYQTTQHLIANHVIALDGDRATGVAYLQAQHFNTEPGKSLLVGGYYSNDFSRTESGWRISKLKLTLTWTRMN